MRAHQFDAHNEEFQYINTDLRRMMDAGHISCTQWLEILESHVCSLDTHLTENIDTTSISHIVSMSDKFFKNALIGEDYYPIPVQYFKNGMLLFFDCQAQSPPQSQPKKQVLIQNNTSIKLQEPSHDRVYTWPMQTGASWYTTVLLCPDELTYNKTAAWLNMQYDAGLKYADNSITEAEHTGHRAQHIFRTLEDKGYTKLGGGLDATVWARDTATAIKIIMPDDAAARDSAAKTFYRFYEFCQSHRDLDCLPRFHRIGGVHHSTFTVDGVDYIQTAMERLQPLEQDSQRTALVWMLSDLATKNMPWARAWDHMEDPLNWTSWDDSEAVTVDDIVNYMDDLSPRERLEWEVLYNTMRLLFHRGRINRMGWDLHTENVMLRGDTLVIIDPWFNAKVEEL